MINYLEAAAFLRKAALHGSHPCLSYTGGPRKSIPQEGGREVVTHLTS